LPRDGQFEFVLDWAIEFGELPPGDYILALLLGGWVHPPHPTGWICNDVLIHSFSIK